MKIYSNRFVRLYGEACGLYWIDVHAGVAGLDALYCIPENAGSDDLEPTYDADGAHEVTAPESQDFLDRINEALGTSLKMDEFDGR